MYTSEDVNSAALYNLHYTGSAKKTPDSQEQYEALLSRWGFSTKPSANTSFSKKLTKFAQAALRAVKASFNMMTASSLLSKQHSANSHIASH
ncbi:hypothetical protein MAQ5080_02600 [Marinomonas aquimarina]|uniref:Uncharacterized protein n=1 Tax=Marinomonas aquimarina TaxID=295068 RepID=A0A1A8TLV4_9GAMM|nr:hypothetical protein [Marinomonas aquimarina]SBS33502.1 hypothetical protein MAQ5080_02600 [Marinomonas aquimarina]